MSVLSRSRCLLVLGNVFLSWECLLDDLKQMVGAV